MEYQIITFMSKYWYINRRQQFASDLSWKKEKISSERDVHAVSGRGAKMHDLKMTDKENWGSGKWRTGKWPYYVSEINNCTTLCTA